MIDFTELNTINYWELPETIDKYPKCKNVLQKNNVYNNLHEMKELVQKYRGHTFYGTPMAKLGSTCFDLAMATKTGNFKTDEAADNFLSGKVNSIVSLLQKTKNCLQKI